MFCQVDLEEPTAVTGIVTQGASKVTTRMWVTTFVIEYSKDGVHYKTVRDVYGPNPVNEVSVTKLR